MINKQKHPATWASLIYELEDAQEHLAKLVSELASDPDYGEENFRVDLGHIFAHLNRAWHYRNADDGLSDDQWHEASQFPGDLDPI